MPFSIPARSYPGQDAAIATVATPALLLGTDAMTVAEVRRAMDVLFRSTGVTRTGGPAAMEIAPASARTGLTVPLHPGAAAWLEETRR